MASVWKIYVSRVTTVAMMSEAKSGRVELSVRLLNALCVFAATDEESIYGLGERQCRIGICTYTIDCGLSKAYASAIYARASTASASCSGLLIPRIALVMPGISIVARMV